MSAVDLPEHPHTPDGLHHEPPVIIDVDSSDGDDIVYVGSARPTRRRRIGEDGSAVAVTSEVIDVTDSEDDNEIQFVGHNPGRPQAPQAPLVRRSRIFSPPPPPQIGGIPPVPDIPQRFLRPRPPTGLVIPNEDPFPFEADLRAASPVGQAIPVAAPPSHHLPAMGFGGALIANVRHIMGHRNIHRTERRNGWGVSGSFIMRWDPFDFAGGEEGNLLDGLDEIGFLAEEDNPLGAGRVRSRLEHAFKQRDREAQVEPDYKPEYTHPDRPSPGFTYDFSASSSPTSADEDGVSAADMASGSGARPCEATLICAACRDPLVLGASDVGEDRAKRKLWGLRCGHLLDGKCIEKLMEPAPPTSDASGSGAMPMDSSPSPGQDTVAAGSDAGLVRSRLRPRRAMAGVSPSVRHAPLSGHRGGAIKAQPTHRSSRKGKGKMKAPVVEAEHEWRCPVSSCKHAHLSLLMDGRWTMDEKRGAIAVFV